MKKLIDEIIFYAIMFSSIVVVTIAGRTINVGPEKNLIIYGGINLIILIILVIISIKRKKTPMEKD